MNGRETQTCTCALRVCFRVGLDTKPAVRLAQLMRGLLALCAMSVFATIMRIPVLITLDTFVLWV